MADSLAFIDESGGPDKPSFVLGGYIAKTEEWAAFSDDWQAVLNRDPPWPALHMAPCHYAKEEPWCNFSEEDRDQRLEDLVSVIAKHKPHAFLTAIDTQRLSEAEVRNAEIKEISEGHPYLMAAGALISSLLEFHEAKGVDFGVIDFVFDFQQQFRRKVKKEVDEILAPGLKQDFPLRSSRLGSRAWPRGKEKDSHIPLQAADMLVWHWRRGRDEPGGRYLRCWSKIRFASRPLLLKYPGDSDLGQLFSAHV